MRFNAKQQQELKNGRLFELSVREPEKVKSLIVVVKNVEDTEIVFGGSVLDLSFNTIAVVDKLLGIYSQKTGVGYSEAAEIFAATIKEMGKNLDKAEVGKNGIQ